MDVVSIGIIPEESGMQSKQLCSIFCCVSNGLTSVPQSFDRDGSVDKQGDFHELSEEKKSICCVLFLVFD